MASTLLDTVAATGAGSAVGSASIAPAGMSHKGVLSNYSVSIAYTTAAPTAATIKLQGSNDGTTWHDMGNTTDVSATTVGFLVVNTPFDVVRGNVSAYTAGSNAGITMIVSGVN